MKFSDFVCFDAIIPQLQSDRRDDVIAELVTSLHGAGKLGDVNPETIIKAVIKREKEASTGMGKGVAIPHVKHPSLKKAVATFGQSPGGVNFSALDKQPVYSVILLLSPVDDPDNHLQAMEKVFTHLQQEKFRKFLRQAQTRQQIVDLLKEADENPSLLA